MDLAFVNSKVDSLGDAILEWARPTAWPKSPLEKYPLTDFRSAFYVAVGYLIFVFIASTYMKIDVESTKEGKEKAQRRLKHIAYPFQFVYNVTQVMLCSYMCIEAGVQAWKANYSILPGNAFNFKNPPIAFVLYVFYLSKVLDFADTVFIIATRSWNQLSFLHVYHHFSIFLFYWLNCVVGFDGDVYLTIVLNGLIHTIMYTYYFVSMHTKEIWWKSALTLGQMIQFIVMNLQAGYLIIMGRLEFPPRITQAYLYYIMTLLALFFHFYLQSYVFKKRSKDSSSGRKKVE